MIQGVDCGSLYYKEEGPDNALSTHLIIRVFFAFLSGAALDLTTEEEEEVTIWVSMGQFTPLHLGVHGPIHTTTFGCPWADSHYIWVSMTNTYMI